MRMNQYMGLPQEALEFLKKNTKKVKVEKRKTFPDGIINLEQFEELYRNEFDFIDTIIDEGGFPLYEYQLKDGRVAREQEQCEIWSNGPMYFLKLVIYDIENQNNDFMFTWSDDEINKLVI
jgi:hypothetical protein